MRTWLFLAVLLVAGCMQQAQPWGSQPREATTTTRAVIDEGEFKVRVAPKDLSCNSDEDCDAVLTQCSWCDCGTAVNRAHVQKYKDLFDRTCGDYRGPVCDMACEPTKLRCIGGACALVTD